MRRALTPEQRERKNTYSREWKRKWRAAHPGANAAAARAWRARHPEEAREKLRAWRVANPEKFSSSLRKAARKRACGVADGRADGTCEICGEYTTKIHLDHDHASGYIRGWLCRGCNLALGNMKDSPELLRKAADYLERTMRRHDDGNDG